MVVNGFNIGGDKTYIIADVGSNHRQDLSLAKESIIAAKEAGANAVKFQSIQVDKLYYNPSKATRDFVSQLEFPEYWHRELSVFAKQIGITFFSSPTYLKAIDLLEEIDVPIYKIASAQIGTYPQLVEEVAKLNKPTIISTGIADYKEVSTAVEIFEANKNKNYIILHCNSIYPAPPEIVNLELMNVYSKMFNCITGFSDHTVGDHIILAAVARGAKVVEKHFTLSRDIVGPDSNSFASDPKELSGLVKKVRDVEAACRYSVPRTQIMDEELEFKNSIRYRLRATRDIGEFEQLTSSNTDFIRFAEGLDAAEVFNIGLNRLITNKQLLENSFINHNDIIKK